MRTPPNETRGLLESAWLGFNQGTAVDNLNESRILVIANRSVPPTRMHASYLRQQGRKVPLHFLPLGPHVPNALLVLYENPVVVQAERVQRLSTQRHPRFVDGGGGVGVGTGRGTKVGVGVRMAQDRV